MTPQFRYAILMADDKTEPNIVKTEKWGEVDDNTLHQLQRMFGFLQLSNRRDFDTTGFCYSFKDFQGMPVNTGVQKDAQEFLNQIFEKLESGLKMTPFKNIM